MAVSSRHNIIVILLAVYWAVLFILAHRPIPGWVYAAEVSDKAIHFTAYLILTFLLWCAFRLDVRVNWMRWSAWLVLAVLAGYGAIDELLQPYVGRTADLYDFAANMAGVIGGMVILTFLRFRPALLAVTVISIFAITNLARANIAEQLPVANVLFHIFAYAFLTGVWLSNLAGRQPVGKLRWCVCGVGGPIAAVIVVKVSSQLLGRYWRLEDTLISAAAIAVVVASVGTWDRVKWRVHGRRG